MARAKEKRDVSGETRRVKLLMVRCGDHRKKIVGIQK